jgi:hypothetical protein
LGIRRRRRGDAKQRQGDRETVSEFERHLVLPLVIDVRNTSPTHPQFRVSAQTAD